MTPTVAVLGKGDLAIRIADFFAAPECGFALVGIVPVLPEPAWAASLGDWARSRLIPTFDHYRDLPDGIDLAFSCFYDKILPADFIRRQNKVVNLHNGPLPKYRGVNPINWALKNGEREHGVTIHEVTPGIDDGPILAQVKFSIYPEIEDVRDVYVKALEFGWTLFRTTIGNILEIQGIEQDHSKASYYSKRDFERLGDRGSLDPQRRKAGIEVEPHQSGVIMIGRDTPSIPFLDLREQNRRIAAELDAAVAGVVSNAEFILGPAVARFESNFAAYLGSRFCIGVNSGTSALHMALIACGIGPGDEVIATSHTWISTSWAISYVGAKPVHVDIDPATYNLDSQRVADAITPRTKAILAVHLYGQSCDMDALQDIAAKHGLLLLEDAAQAHGTMWRGRRAGSIGKVGCFSFYPGKNLGAFGEAGAVVSDDEPIAERIRCLRDHAQQTRHHHVEIGFNARMEGIQGAVLDAKLRHLESWNEARRRHASHYRRALADVKEITLPAPPADPCSHVWHLFVVLLDRASRHKIQQLLAEKGIATGVHYPTPVPLQPAYAHLKRRIEDFPIACDVTSRCLSLPLYPELREEQVTAVAEAVKTVCRQEGRS